MAFATKKEFLALARRVEEVELKLAGHGKEPTEPETVEVPDIESLLGDEEPEQEQAFEIVDKKVTDLLVEAGYTSKDQVAAASDEELRSISGVGPKVLEYIRAAVEE